MEMVRQVVVFDAADVGTESRFWAGMLGGIVVDDDEGFHCVLDLTGAWRIGVQWAPGHVAPGWPDGAPQQVHLDLHVDDPQAAHLEAIRLGATVLQAAPSFDVEEGHQVYADPAGHPFCIGWGHPTSQHIRARYGDRLLP